MSISNNNNNEVSETNNNAEELQAILAGIAAFQETLQKMREFQNVTVPNFIAARSQLPPDYDYDRDARDQALGNLISEIEGIDNDYLPTFVTEEFAPLITSLLGGSIDNKVDECDDESVVVDDEAGDE